MTVGRRDIFTQPFVAQGTIERGRLVKLVGSGTVAKANSSTDIIIGVANPTFDYSANNVVDIWLLGATYVKAGAAITAGQLITANSDGKGIPATAGSRTIGIALENCLVDDLFCMHIFPGAI